MPKNFKEFKEQVKRDNAKRIKNLQIIRKEEERQIVILQLKTLFIIEKFRKMYLENPNILSMFQQYFSNHDEIENKKKFVKNLLQGDVMVLTNMGKNRLTEFVNYLS